jgi:hypothetical protein
METGLFEIQAGYLLEYRQARQLLSNSRDVIHATFGRTDLGGGEPHARSLKGLNQTQAVRHKRWSGPGLTPIAQPSSWLDAFCA